MSDFDDEEKQLIGRVRRLPRSVRFALMEVLEGMQACSAMDELSLLVRFRGVGQAERNCIQSIFNGAALKRRGEVKICQR